MWIIVGLGNPGRRYAKTRHNIGFVVVEAIAGRYGIAFLERDSSREGEGSIKDTSIVLVEPLTFMNRSGLAVREVLRRYGAGPENLIVVQDDIDMETGKLRIRKRGSAGGHRGIASIIAETGSCEFVRVKIGVGREEGVPAEDYVLGRFRPDERPVINETVEAAVEAVGAIVSDGIESAMNRFN